MSGKEATKPVRKGEELNEKDLKRFLVDNGLIHDEKSEMIVGQFQNGYSNLTYQLNIEEKEYVLRRPPYSAPKRGHDMGREFKVLHSLHKVFDKTPRVYAYSEDPEILGVPFYIMEKVNGIILTTKEAGDRKLTPSEFVNISDTWLDTFVELHGLDYKKAGLESLGRPQGYVARQVTNWGKQYLAAATARRNSTTTALSLRATTAQRASTRATTNAAHDSSMADPTANGRSPQRRASVKRCNSKPDRRAVFPANTC